MARRLQYETPGEMQALIKEYFETCKKHREGKVQPESITDDLHPTVIGLANVLQLTRKSLINYGNREEFSEIVQDAKGKIEAYLVQLLHKDTNGVKFNLTNNFGYKEQSQVENTGPGGGPMVGKIEIEFVDASKRPNDPKNT